MVLVVSLIGFSLCALGFALCGLALLPKKRLPFALADFAAIAAIEAQKTNSPPRSAALRHRQAPSMPVLSDSEKMAANWNVRGAWQDSFRLDFADGWVFPWGTGHLASVEIVSQGEIRPAWNDTNAIARIGARVAIVPGLTAFSCGPTASNSYLVAWTDAAAERSTNDLVTASVELMRNGDRTVTANGVSATLPRELPFAHDGFGQDAEWVQANFTNAAEILAAGYPQWVDAQIGASPWLYRFSVVFADDPPEATLLEVGDVTVAVTNAGEYVFLLEKEIDHAIRTFPSAGCLFCAEDGDGAPGAGCFELLPPADGEYGLARWRSAVAVSPEAVRLDSLPGGGAEISSYWPVARPEDVAWRWFGSRGDAVFTSTNSPSTRLLDFGSGLIVYVEAAYAGHCATGAVSLVRSPATGADGATLAVSMPSAIAVNDDGDCGEAGVMDWDVEGEHGVEDDDIVPVDVVFVSSAPTNGMLRISNVSGFSHFWRDRSRGDEMQCDEIPVSNRCAAARTYWLEADSFSISSGIDALVAEWIGSEGTLARTNRFTAIARIAEPVCNRIAAGADGSLQILNPCCALIGSGTPMRVEVEPADFPQAQIRWNVVSGSAAFPGGNTGTNVMVVATGSENEQIVLEVEFGDCPGRRPRFTLDTVSMHCATIFPCVVYAKGDDPGVERSRIEELVEEVNMIYRQVGLHFTVADEIRFVENKIWAKDGLKQARVGRAIRNHMSNTGGVEVYFIDGVGKSNNGKKSRTGACSDYGIIVKKSANAKTLAHEIGHACGWSDIYYTADEDGGEETDFTLYVPPREEWMPLDWNNGTGARFYDPWTGRQRDVIQRLVMYGESNPDKADIPLGYVYGYARDSVHGKSLGNCAVGRRTMICFPPRNL